MQNKTMGKKKFFRAMMSVLCVVLLMSVELTPVMAKVTQADSDALKGDASDLAKEKKELEAKLSALSKDKTQALNRKNLLHQQISVLTSEITNVESQISNYTTLIAQTEQELLEAQEQEELKYEQFCKRVRAMEERGNIS